MTRVEYIQQLEFSLGGKLPQREISEILRDYSEYFEAGKSEGKSEEEIAMSLGIPSAVAAQILSEIEEEAAQKKENKKAQREIFPTFEKAAKKLWSFLKKLLSFFGGFFGDLFGKLRPGLKRAESAYSRFSHPAPPQGPGMNRQSGTQGYAGADGRPADEDAYPPPPQNKQKKQRRPAAAAGEGRKSAPRRHGFFPALTKLCMLPFVLMACGLGVALLAILGFCILGLILLMGLLFLFFLVAILAGGIAFSVAGGLGLPLSFHLLFIIALIFCLAGSILSVCGTVYLVRGLIRLIRSCFGSVNWAKRAQGPAAVQEEGANVYADGWDAPTPPPTPDDGPAAGSAPTKEQQQRYEQLLHEPVPEPRLSLGDADAQPQAGEASGNAPAGGDGEEKGEDSHA